MQCLCNCRILFVLPSWRTFRGWGRWNTVFALACHSCDSLLPSLVSDENTSLRVWVELLGMWWLTLTYLCRVEDLAMGACMELWRVSIRQKGLVACSVGSLPLCYGMHPSLGSTWCSTRRPKNSHLRVRLNFGSCDIKHCFSLIVP